MVVGRAVSLSMNIFLYDHMCMRRMRMSEGEMDRTVVTGQERNHPLS